MFDSHPFLKSPNFETQNCQSHGVKRIKSIFANKEKNETRFRAPLCITANSSHFFNKTDFEQNVCNKHPRIKWLRTIQQTQLILNEISFYLIRDCYCSFNKEWYRCQGEESKFHMTYSNPPFVWILQSSKNFDIYAFWYAFRGHNISSSCCNDLKVPSLQKCYGIWSKKAILRSIF